MSKYDDLITSEHAKRPRFVAVIDVTVQPSLDQQGVIVALPDDFDLDTATGAQLDVVGEWVGISRYIMTPLVGVYFSWGTAGVGWGQGYWKGQFDPSQGVTSLPDDFYRLLLRATIALNYWDGGLQGAIDALTPLFPDNAVFVQDGQDMTISVSVSGPAPNAVLASLLTGGYLSLKPDGVRINYYFPSSPIGPVFGFGANNDFIGGWGYGSWGRSSPSPSPLIVLQAGDGIDLYTASNQLLEVAV